MDLSSLPMGSRAIIEGVDAPDALRQRLCDLGFYPGATVEAVRRSPGGDPVAFRICGAVICLRSADARRITVRPADRETAGPGANGRRARPHP